MDSNPLLTLDDKVKPQHTAVLVIDMQNDFCSPQGVVSKRWDWQRVQALIPKLSDFLGRARDNHVRVVFVQMIQEETKISGPLKELMARWGQDELSCKLGTWGAMIVDDLQPSGDDTVIEKNRYSAFVSPTLDSRLQRWGICTLILTGVGTTVCLESTARDGFMKDYYIIVPRDLTAARTKGTYETSLENIDRHFGQVVSSEQVAAIWLRDRKDPAETG